MTCWEGMRSWHRLCVRALQTATRILQHARCQGAGCGSGDVRSGASPRMQIFQPRQSFWRHAADAHQQILRDSKSPLRSEACMGMGLAMQHV